jgi:DNA repair protein RecO (recombination protein O)
MIKTKAIILKSADSNEVDRLLTVYSEKLGKVNISARGVKKLESKLRCSIETITHTQMILVEGKNFLILKDSVILDQFLKIKKNPEKIKIAQKLAELIDEAIIGEEKDENIWKLALFTLRSIEEDKISIKSAIADFQRNLIKFLGYNPQDIKNLNQIY